MMQTKLSLTLTRHIKASPSAVFRAWTESDYANRWAGPANFDVVENRADVRVGGNWRTVMRNLATNELHESSGTYREIVPDRKLVFTFAWKDDPVDNTICTVDLRERDGGTLMTFTQEPFDDASERDGHFDGWSQSFDKLEELLALSSR
jgi:uncharacterized protein YndB with AHSA1/START domain